MDRVRFQKLYYDDSLSRKEVAKRLGFSETMVKYWRRKFNLPVRDFRVRKPTYNLTFEISPQLVYVLGVMLGDGSARKYKRFYKGKPNGIQYIIKLRTTDEPFAETFCRHLKFLGMNAYIKRIPSEPRVFNVIAYCKAFYDWYTNLSLNDIEKIANLYPVEFLRGFYESEGWVSTGTYLDKRNPKQYKFRPRYCLGISNYKKELLELVQHILSKLGYNLALYHRESKGEYWLMTCKKSQVYAIIKTLNPCIKKLRVD